MLDRVWAPLGQENLLVGASQRDLVRLVSALLSHFACTRSALSVSAASQPSVDQS